MQHLKHVRLRDYPITATLDRRADGIVELRIYDTTGNEPKLIRIKTMTDPTNRSARDGFSRLINSYYPNKGQIV
jgi:hypothetical protein